MSLRTKIAVVLAFFFLNSVNAQVSEFGKPFIDNYTVKNYRHENQNFSVVQDTNGLTYFGNLNGIMQFDGEYWKYLNLIGSPLLCKTEKGLVFAGAYKTFGLLELGRKGEMQFRDLSKTLTDAGFEFERVQQMLTIGDAVIVNAPPHVFVVDSALNTEHLITVENDPVKIFVGKDPIVLLKDGLFKIDLAQYEISPINFLEFNDIDDIFPFKDKYLIVSKEGRWDIYDRDFKHLKTVENQVEKLLRSNKIRVGTYLPNGMFAFGTESCGLVVLDSLGRMITHINQSNGLLDNDVRSIYVDDNQNLWLALNNGISVLNFPSVFTVFDKDYGIQGALFDVIRYGEKIYVASSQGVYWGLSDFNRNDCEVVKFIKVSGINQQCKSFLKTDEKLFVTNENGIYELDGNTAKKVSCLVSQKLVMSDNSENTIFAATKKGVVFLKEKGDTLELSGRLKGFNKSARSLAETEDGNLWVGTDYEGLFYVNFKAERGRDTSITQYKESNGLPKNHRWVDVFKTRKGIFFSTRLGLFVYDSSKNQFIKRYLVDSLDSRWYYPLVEDNRGNLWFSSGESNNYTYLTGLEYYIPRRDSFVTVTQMFNQIKDYTVESIYVEDNTVVWFGSIDGLIRFDIRNINPKKNLYKTVIRGLTFGYDSIVNPFSLNTLDKIKLPYKLNGIQIQAGTDSYQPQDDVMFQFWLEGLEDYWSNWQASGTKQYFGLKEGKYTLHIRSKNIYDVVTEPISLTFKIEPPYYRSVWAFLSYFLLVALLVYLIFRYRAFVYQKERYKLERIIGEKTEEIVKQKERAEDLVKSILPEDTAKELQAKGRKSRKKYEMVTVLFSDIQGFTEISEDLSPDILLDELDQYVMRFDNVVEKYGIEKIKTIGDAYMCAGGIPNKNRTNPVDVVLAGLQMIHYAKEVQKHSGNKWGIRFGVHTGPVIAGIVGSKKLTYDIWGDTVNTASRMESYGKVGHLNISHSTYELVSAFFDCDFRGTIPVKYKGNMKMYFVKGLKFEYASDYKRIVPNDKFLLKMQFIRFADLEDLILTKLEKGLDKRLYYHNVKHTIDVVNQVEIIGIGEGVTDEEMILLKTAALFHDLGHTVSFLDHEEQGIIFAKDILPNYYYTPKQIEIISELIFATKFPPEPRNKLEEIICDADLDYLGRDDFLPTSHKLYLEMFEHGRIDNIASWNKIQVSFLKSHQYYTETARNARQVNKIEQLRKIEEQVKKESES